MSKIIDLELKGTKAKGRNGMFEAKSIGLIDHKDNIWIEVWSRRTDGKPPVWLDMCLEDARDLRDALNKLLKE